MMGVPQISIRLISSDLNCEAISSCLASNKRHRPSNTPLLNSGKRTFDSQLALEIETVFQIDICGLCLVGYFLGARAKNLVIVIEERGFFLVG